MAKIEKFTSKEKENQVLQQRSQWNRLVYSSGISWKHIFLITEHLLHASLFLLVGCEIHSWAGSQKMTLKFSAG